MTKAANPVTSDGLHQPTDRKDTRMSLWTRFCIAVTDWLDYHAPLDPHPELSRLDVMDGLNQQEVTR